MGAIGFALIFIGVTLKGIFQGSWAFSQSTDGWWVVPMAAGLLLMVASATTWLWRVAP